MRDVLLNRRLIPALVASAAFAVASSVPLAAAEPSSDPAPSEAVTVVALAPSSALDAQSAPDASAKPSAPELTQLARPLPQLLPPPVIVQPAPPVYYHRTWPFFQPAQPAVVRPAPVRRVVRRAPARTAAPAVRVVRSELPPRRIALFGVGFGF